MLMRELAARFGSRANAVYLVLVFHDCCWIPCVAGRIATRNKQLHKSYRRWALIKLILNSNHKPIWPTPRV
jgi:hypothetical protein